MFKVGDWGVVRLTVVVLNGSSARDISAATGKQFRIQRPNGEVFLKTATFTGTGTDGSLYYVWEQGVLNMGGQWSGEAVCTFADGSQCSQDFTFHVKDVLRSRT